MEEAIQVLGKILCDGKSSRLYKKIVDKGLATSLFMHDFPFKDNGLFITYAFLTPDTDNQIVEDIILNEYNNIILNGVDDSEILRAVAQIRATVAFSRDGSYAVASALNEAIAIGDWEFYTSFLENINLMQQLLFHDQLLLFLHPFQIIVAQFVYLFVL